MNKILLLLLTLTVLSSCKKDKLDEILTVDFTITHDTYSNVESPFTVIEIKDKEGVVIADYINLGGDEPTWSVTLQVPSSGEETDVKIYSSREGGKNVIANGVRDGSQVSWNTADSTPNVSGGGGEGLQGRWNQLPTQCTNSNGDGNYFSFSSATGVVFQADCNSTCAGGGVSTSFNYSTSGSNVTITPTSVSTYCGETAAAPAAFTVPYSISGNILTLDGQDFERN
jgi:hypothetical protein